MFFVGQMCVNVLIDSLDVTSVRGDERVDPKYIEQEPLVKSVVVFFGASNVSQSK